MLTATQPRVQLHAKNMIVRSNVSDDEALALLKTSDDAFALRLVATYHEIRKYGDRAGQRMGWTESQRAWAHLMAMRIREEQSK